MQKIESHPYVAHLKAQGFHQLTSQDVNQGPAADQFTRQTLSGDTKIAKEPLLFSKIKYTYFNTSLTPEQEKAKQNEFVTIYYLGSHLQGYAGIVHGGMVATIFDGVLYRCCHPFVAMHKSHGFTRYLKIEYNRPLRVGRYLAVHARMVKVIDDRKYIVRGEVIDLSEFDPLKNLQPKPLASSEALFIEPRNYNSFKPKELRDEQEAKRNGQVKNTSRKVKL